MAARQGSEKKPKIKIVYKGKKNQDEAKVVEKPRMGGKIVTTLDKPEPSNGKKKRSWKTKIGRMNNMIINDGNLE